MAELVDNVILDQELDRVDSFFCEYLMHRLFFQKLDRYFRVKSHSFDVIEVFICENSLSQQRDQIMYALSKHLIGSLTTLVFLRLINREVADVMLAILHPYLQDQPLDVGVLMRYGFISPIKNQCNKEDMGPIFDEILTIKHVFNY